MSEIVDLPIDAHTTVPQTLAVYFGNMFDKQESCDIKFIIPNETDGHIHAHKFILMRSEVFRKMFNGDWLEKDQVIITDIDAKSFKHFIRFFYTDEIDWTDFDCSSIHHLVYLARKYEMSYLEVIVNRHTIKLLNVDNVCQLLQHFQLYENDVSRKCEEFIRRYTLEIIQKESFRNIDVCTLKRILSWDRLAANETQLFAATLIWAENECQRLSIEVTPANKRNVLDRAIDLIRTTEMTMIELEDLIRVNKDYFEPNEIGKALLKRQANLLTTKSVRYQPFYLVVPIDSFDETSMAYTGRFVESLDNIHFSKPVKLIGFELRQVNITNDLSCIFEVYSIEASYVESLKIQHYKYTKKMDSTVVRFVDGLALYSRAKRSFKICNYIIDSKDFISEPSKANRLHYPIKKMHTVLSTGKDEISIKYTCSSSFLIKSLLIELVE